MAEFILDVNVDLKDGNPGFPSFLIADLRTKNRNVVLVRGGTRYDKEIRQKHKLRDLMVELAKSGKVRRCPNESVDQKEAEIDQRIQDRLGCCPAECDDQHFLALAIVSGCMNIVTNDARLAQCRDKIRNKIGHAHCPDIRVVQSESSYRDSFSA